MADRSARLCEVPGIRAGATASHRDLSDCRRALGVRRRSRPRLGGRGPHATFPERWSSRGPSLREMRRAGDAYEMIRVVPEHQLVLKRIVSLQALADVPDVVAATDQRLPGENSSLGRGSTPGLGGVRPGATSCRRCGQRAGRRNRLFAATSSSPLTDSNRRPPPYHGGARPNAAPPR